MFVSATAATPALSRRRASLVENSEQVKIETALFSELRRGLYLIREATLAMDDSDRSAARLDTIAAYESARNLLNHSPFPITESAFRKRCDGWNQQLEATSCLEVGNPDGWTARETGSHPRFSKVNKITEQTRCEKCAEILVTHYQEDFDS